MEKISSLIKKVANAPKAELHVHIEGTLEPEMIFKFAQRNNIILTWTTIDSLREAYNFENLQSFLDLYYEGTRVLLTEDDFYEMTLEYMNNAIKNGIIHCEIFFDPQSHISRGIGFDIFVPGMIKALEEAKEMGLSSQLIMCFLRHLPEDDALDVFYKSRKWLSLFPQWITGVGLDSSEKGNPPSKFTRVFKLAKQAGLRCVAHAGEEGPSEYIWEAINILGSERIDHGVRCTEDSNLLEYLKETQIPLTICPLSNVKLGVYNNIAEHPLRDLLDYGINVTINSDDPSYFGGYVNVNYHNIITALKLNSDDCYCLLRNSFRASFCDSDTKNKMIERLDKYWFDHSLIELKNIQEKK
jgi:adenosine deaminase